MARNIFDLRFNLLAQKLSIKQTATKLISLLELLRIEDEVFSKFKVTKLHFKSVEFDLSEGDTESNILKLSETILRFELADIRHYEKEENPTIDFSRDFGFRVLMNFNEKKKKRFTITGNIATNQFSVLSIEYFPLENSDYDFDWYFNVLRKSNQFLLPVYSGIRIILDQYMELYWPLKIKFPFGWITYFSNESNIKMPTDAGFEVIQEENGQYVIVTREDFTKSKESFFEIKDKLINGMKLLKENCPDYSEES